jgi:hypothetical protein
LAAATSPRWCLSGAEDSGRKTAVAVRCRASSFS